MDPTSAILGLPSLTPLPAVVALTDPTGAATDRPAWMKALLGTRNDGRSLVRFGERPPATADMTGFPWVAALTGLLITAFGGKAPDGATDPTGALGLFTASPRTRLYAQAAYRSLEAARAPTIIYPAMGLAYALLPWKTPFLLDPVLDWATDDLNNFIEGRKALAKR